MFSTIESVEEYTGYNLTKKIEQLRAYIAQKKGFSTVSEVDVEFEVRALLLRAQALIEAFVGKDEIDVENPTDLTILNKMTAYQAVYMLENEDKIFNQIAVTSQGQTDFIINFDNKMYSPFIAPLAYIASNGLTWRKSKSVKTGKVFQFPKITKWRNV